MKRRNILFSGPFSLTDFLQIVIIRKKATEGKEWRERERYYLRGDYFL